MLTEKVVFGFIFANNTLIMHVSGNANNCEPGWSAVDLNLFADRFLIQEQQACQLTAENDDLVLRIPVLFLEATALNDRNVQRGEIIRGYSPPHDRAACTGGEFWPPFHLNARVNRRTRWAIGRKGVSDGRSVERRHTTQPRL